MNSPKRLARIAGLLYLIVGIFGGFAAGYATPIGRGVPVTTIACARTTRIHKRTTRTYVHSKKECSYKSISPISA